MDQQPIHNATEEIKEEEKKREREDKGKEDYFGIPARSSLTVCLESARKKMTTG